MVVLQFLSSGKFICVYGVEISDACLTAIWLTARKSDLFLAGKCAGLGMNIIQYLDNNLLNRLHEFDGEVYTHDVPASFPVSAGCSGKTILCPRLKKASRLHRTYKVFTSLDVSNRFWHVVLDEESSFCTTFKTLFGRYHWKMMPFGIRSAPEVFQHKMLELIEGLRGVEVIADDSVVVGYGESWQSAIKDHDRNLLSFL